LAFNEEEEEEEYGAEVFKLVFGAIIQSAKVFARLYSFIILTIPE
jgi:hypothetical protein